MGFSTIPSLEASDIIELLRQVDAENASKIDVPFRSTRERSPDINRETGLWVEHIREETYRFVGGNCKKVYDLTPKLKQAECIYVVWEDGKTMKIHDCFTKITLSGFTAMPFDLSKLVVYPREVIFTYN